MGAFRELGCIVGMNSHFVAMYFYGFFESKACDHYPAVLVPECSISKPKLSSREGFFAIRMFVKSGNFFGPVATWI